MHHVTRVSEQRRERSREEFGPEYERTAREKGSEKEADKELRRRRGSVERRVEPLSDERREHFEGQWGEVERVFVDNPQRSIEMADRTVSDILDERRFVSDASESEEETEKNLAAMHPDVADDYREARRMRADVVARSGRSADGPRKSSPRRSCTRRSASTGPCTSAWWNGKPPPGMLLGTAVFFFAEREVNRGGGESRKNSADEQGGSTAAIAIGALLDGILESAAIGISLIEGGIGIALVAAVFLSNVPEGLSSAAGMKRAGLAPRPTCSASGAPSRWPRPSPR